MKSSLMISKNNHLLAKEWRHSEFLQEDERFSDKKFTMPLIILCHRSYRNTDLTMETAKGFTNH